MSTADIYRDFLEDLTSCEADEDVYRILQDIESLLRHSELRIARIAYLEVLNEFSEEDLKDFPNVKTGSISDPLTLDQHIYIITNGILKSYENGEVSVNEICQLTHSADGLKVLQNLLEEVPDTEQAELWNEKESAKAEKGELEQKIPRQPLKLQFSLIVRRVSIAAILTLIITFLLIPFYEKSKLGIHNLTPPLLDSPSLAKAGVVPEICIGPDLQTCLRKLINSNASSSRENEITSFKYGYLDEDKILDYVITGNGYVLCLSKKRGKIVVNWKFKLTPNCLDPEFLPSLEETLDYGQYYASPPDPEEPNKRRTDNQIFNKWIDLPPHPTVAEAWPILAPDLQILKICDYDGDGKSEVVLGFFGAVIILDSDGKQKEYTFEGNNHKSIKILDGLFFDQPWELYDLNDDGKMEFIIYRMIGHWTDFNTKAPLEIRDIDGNSLYVYNGELYNSRGLYVASHEGKEVWHLNLPYQCHRIDVKDWDDDDKPEIILDTHVSCNGYIMNYDLKSNDIVSKNFDLNTVPEEVLKGENILNESGFVDDLDVGFLILGMDNGPGEVEFWKDNIIPYCEIMYGDEGGLRPENHLCSRNISYIDSERIECLRYSATRNLKTNTFENWTMQSWIPNPQTKQFDISNGSINGFARLYNYQDSCMFGVKTDKGLRRILGICPGDQVSLIDEDFSVISTYKLENHKGESKVIWKDKSRDVVVFDVKDIDNNGQLEILVGFVDLSGESDNTTSLVKILTISPETEELIDFHPDSGCDGFVVAGKTILNASFEKIDGDDKYDILVTSSENVYFKSIKWDS